MLQSFDEKSQFDERNELQALEFLVYFCFIELVVYPIFMYWVCIRFFFDNALFSTFKRKVERTR